jgi:hypothetical protein
MAADWRRVMAGVLAAALAGAAAHAAPRFPPRPTPAEVEASLARNGARATVSALFDQRRWDYVSDRIGAGDGAWVALAPRLAAGADAGTAEDLPIALAFALPRNPAAVLAALGSGAFDIGEVCGAPFIEGTVSDLPAYVRRARAAVRRVDAPALAAARRACLAALA